MRVLLPHAMLALVGLALLVAVAAARSTVSLAILAMIGVPAASLALLARAAIIPGIVVAAATICE